MQARQRVLTCDPSAQYQRALRVVLRDAGFAVLATSDLQEALDCAAVRAPDAAIVELKLPDGDAIEFCRRVRAWSALPVIVLCDAATENDKVVALEAGADDFVHKPFAPRELVARLGAMLRRAEPSHREPMLDLGALQIDLGDRTVHSGESEIRLTPTEVRLLCALARRCGRLLTHRALLQQVWGPAHGDASCVLRTTSPTSAERSIRTVTGCL